MSPAATAWLCNHGRPSSILLTRHPSTPILMKTHLQFFNAPHTFFVLIETDQRPFPGGGGGFTVAYWSWLSTASAPHITPKSPAPHIPSQGLLSGASSQCRVQSTLQNAASKFAPSINSFEQTKIDNVYTKVKTVFIKHSPV